jgi:hypothetical protein
LNEERKPTGSDEVESADLGEPERLDEQGHREERPRPDPAERHERIRTHRKAMGPPLREPDEPAPLEEQREAPDEEPPVPPTDPD